MADSKKKAAPAPVEVKTGNGTTLDVEALRQVVEILEASEVTRLVWRNGREKLYIRRGHPPAPVMHAAPVQHSGPGIHVMAPAPAPLSVPSSSPQKSAPRPSIAQPAPAAAAAPEKKGHVITSPFVGTFYRTPAPDQPPFVDVGSVVKKGQTLCIVEAMKLMNEIESEVAGKVVEVLAQNAQPVEFGQPLFRIEPV